MFPDSCFLSSAKLLRGILVSFIIKASSLLDKAFLGLPTGFLLGIGEDEDVPVKNKQKNKSRFVWLKGLFG